MILVNFKRYEEAMGERAVMMARICKEVAVETGVKIYPVVRAMDAYRVAKEAGIEVYLQKPEDGEEVARGVLINHSDFRLKPGMIGNLLKKQDKLESIVCLQSLGQAERWARRLKPSFFAYEPKELIGNRERSVTSEYLPTVRKMVEILSPTPLLIGAGIHRGEDIEIARKEGVAGFLVATDVVKAENPKKELTELARAFSV